jgi:hypothetical protein
MHEGRVMGHNPFLDNLTGVKFPEPFRRLEINLSHGAAWKALINTYK